MFNAVGILHFAICIKYFALCILLRDLRASVVIFELCLTPDRGFAVERPTAERLQP